MLRHPCVLRGPLQKGRETKEARAGLLEKIPWWGSLIVVLNKKKILVLKDHPASPASGKKPLRAGDKIRDGQQVAQKV